MRSVRVRLLALLVAIVMIATACGGGSDSPETSSGNDADTSNVETSDNDTSDDGGDDDGGDDEPADEPETEDTVELIEDDSDDSPVFGGTLRYGLEADVDGINPSSSALSSPGLMMANAVFDTLAAFDADGNWQPFLAESFTPNDDFTVWTMKLREGVTFHDGTPLNAEAVLINFSAQYGDPLVGLAVRPFYVPFDEGAGTAAAEVIDDLTVQYNLNGPNVNWPTSVTGQVGMVASPTWIAEALEDPTLNQSPVGTGPFSFGSRSEDSVTRFEKNADWWGGDVYLDAVEFVPVPDPDTRNDLLFQGEIQALQTTNPSSILDLQDDETIQNVLDDTGDESFIMMNASKAPFDDIRARQALTFATPRQNYIDLIGLGISQPADQMFTPSSPFYNTAVVQEADQPEKAGPLVEAYCGDNPDNCTDGRIDMELQWSGPSVVQTRIAELLDEGWSDNFNVNFQELPQDQHIQEVAFGVYDVVTWRQFGAVNPGDDRVWLVCDAIGGISLNWPRFCDEDRDALLEELQLATTLEERKPILDQITQKVNEDYLYIFTLHSLWDNAYAENVRGVCSHTTLEGATRRCVINGRSFFDNVWLTE